MRTHRGHDSGVEKTSPVKPASFARPLSGALLLSAALAGCSADGTTAAADGVSGGSAAASGPAVHAHPGAASAAPTGRFAEAPLQGPPSALPASVWIAPGQTPLDAAYTWQAPKDRARGSTAPTFEFEQLCQTTRPTSVVEAGTFFTSAAATFTPRAGGSGGPGSSPGSGVNAAGGDADGPAPGTAAGSPAGAGTESGSRPDTAAPGSSGGADWRAQEDITHDPSIDSGSDQVAFGAFVDLTDELRSCAQAVAGAQVTVSTDGGQEFAATVTIPTPTGSTATLHDYLAVPDGTIVELAFWVAPNAGAQPHTPWTTVPDATVFAAMKAPVCGTYHDC
jgi:hypothetical protein